MGFMILKAGGSCDGHIRVCRAHRRVREFGIMVGSSNSTETSGIARMSDGLGTSGYRNCMGIDPFARGLLYREGTYRSTLASLLFRTPDAFAAGRISRLGMERDNQPTKSVFLFEERRLASDR